MTGVSASVHFGLRPSEEADPERLADRVHAGQMRVELGGDGMDARLRRAGKLELAARLERDRGVAGRLVEADQRALVLDRRPAEARLGAFQQGPDAALALVWNGPQIGRVERELLVLDADAERFGRLAARRQPRRQIVAGFNDLSVDDVAGHAGFRMKNGQMASVGPVNRAPSLTIQ